MMRLASAATRSGSQVLMHRTSFPEPSPSAGKSSLSTTCSTCSVLKTARMTQRADLARSPTDCAGRPPMSARRALRAGSISKPVTEMPASISRRAYTSPISPSPTMPTGALVARSGMRIVPIQFACLAIERSGLQRSILDAIHRHHFRIVAGRKNLVGGLDVAIVQRSLDDADPGIAQQLDDALTRNAVEKCAIRRRREHDAVLADEDIGRRKLRDVAE